MADSVREFVDRAARLVEAREEGLTAEQLARRAEVARRTEVIGRGVHRGPNAHKDGTFGKLKAEPKAGGTT